jgi:predicted MFS family arabinose efflux permease
LAVAGRPAVLATLAVTVLAMVSGFTVLNYVRPLLEGLTGFGGEGIGLMLLAFGLAAVAGSILGGQGLGAGLGSLVLGHLSLAALGYAGALLAAAALVGLVLAARLPLGVTDSETLPESPAERRSDPSAPRVSPCPQP